MSSLLCVCSKQGKWAEAHPLSCLPPQKIVFDSSSFSLERCIFRVIRGIYYANHYHYFFFSTCSLSMLLPQPAVIFPYHGFYSRALRGNCVNLCIMYIPSNPRYILSNLRNVLRNALVIWSLFWVIRGTFRVIRGMYYEKNYLNHCSNLCIMFIPSNPRNIIESFY